MQPAAASGAVARGDIGRPVRDHVGNPVRGDMGSLARSDVGNPDYGDIGNLARAMDAEVCRALFVPAGAVARAGAGVHVVDARAVMSVLR